MAQQVKNLQETQEMQVQSLGQEDLEEEVATHSSVLAWKIPWTEESGGLHTVHGVTGSPTRLGRHSTVVHSQAYTSIYCFLPNMKMSEKNTRCSLFL